MSRAKTALLALSLSALAIASLHGQSGGRDLPPGLRSLAGVTLNRDSAASIRAKLGNTRERRVGAGHAYVALCYVASDSRPPALLELLTDASAVGTPGRALNVIRLRAAAPPRDREGCAPLHSPTLSTPSGLRLGLGVSQIEQLLGRPARSTTDSLAYYFSAKEYLPIASPEYETWNTPDYRESCFDAGPPYANVAGSVIVVLRDGRAVEIRIERDDRSIC